MQLVTQPVFTAWMELARQIADRAVPDVRLHCFILMFDFLSLMNAVMAYDSGR